MFRSYLSSSVGREDSGLKQRIARSLAVWPNWAIYCTLGNFSKPVATIIEPKLPTFFGNILKVSISFIFLIKSFLGNFYRHLAIFYKSHWSLVWIPQPMLRGKIRKHVIYKKWQKNQSFVKIGKNCWIHPSDRSGSVLLRLQQKYFLSTETWK